MDINDITQSDLEEILKREPIQILEVIKKIPGSMNVSFRSQLITSHDLANLLLLLNKKVDRFSLKIEDALKELA